VIQRILGPRSVSAVGLGGMPMSIEGRPDAERSIATIHAALDQGVTLLDSGDYYGAGHNELLIARALKEEESAVLQDLKLSIGKDVTVKSDVQLHHEQFDVMAV